MAKPLLVALSLVALERLSAGSPRSNAGEPFDDDKNYEPHVDHFREDDSKRSARRPAWDVSKIRDTEAAGEALAKDLVLRARTPRQYLLLVREAIRGLRHYGKMEAAVSLRFEAFRIQRLWDTSHLRDEDELHEIGWGFGAYERSGFGTKGDFMRPLKLLKDQGALTRYQAGWLKRGFEDGRQAR